MKLQARGESERTIAARTGGHCMRAEEGNVHLGNRRDCGEPQQVASPERDGAVGAVEEDRPHPHDQEGADAPLVLSLI